MLGTGEYGAESAASDLVFGVIDLQLVETLLREQYCAFAAINLKVMLHFAARRSPVCLQAAACAVHKLYKDPGYIIDLDSAQLRRARAGGTRADQRFNVGHKQPNGANQIACGRKDMAADISQRAAASGRVQTPGPGSL